MKLYFKFSFLLFCSFLLVGSVSAQRYIFIADDFNSDSTNGHDERQVDFHYYTLSSAALDLRDFKSLYPSIAGLPDAQNVVLPSQSGWVDAAYVVTFLTWGESNEGDLITFIVGNYSTPYPVYHFDYNMNGDFTDDGPGFQFARNEKRHRIKLRGEGKKQRYEFVLFSPEKSSEFVEENPISIPVPEVIPVAEKSAEVRKVKDILRLEIGGMINSSDIRYRYIDRSVGYPVTYHAPSTGKGLAFAADVKLLSFHIRAQAAIDNKYYWSSRKITQLGEPYVICDVPGQGCVEFNNVVEVRDWESIPQNELTLGLMLGYDFELGSYFSFSPLVGAGVFKYLQSDFVPDRRDPETTFEMDAEAYFQIGGQFDFTITDASRLYFRTTYMRAKFDPEGFFEQFYTDFLRTSDTNIRLEVGANFSLF